MSKFTPECTNLHPLKKISVEHATNALRDVLQRLSLSQKLPPPPLLKIEYVLGIYPCRSIHFL